MATEIRISQLVAETVGQSSTSNASIRVSQLATETIGAQDHPPVRVSQLLPEVLSLPTLPGVKVSQLVLEPGYKRTYLYPSTGPQGGGTLVHIYGAGFTAGVTVTFGGVTATDITQVSDVEVTCRTPAHAWGPVTVVVTDSSVIRTIPSAFTYYGVPVADSYWYDGLPVLMAGSDFVPVTGVVGPLINRVPVGQGMFGGRLIT